MAGSFGERNGSSSLFDDGGNAVVGGDRGNVAVRGDGDNVAARGDGSGKNKVILEGLEEEIEELIGEIEGKTEDEIKIEDDKEGRRIWRRKNGGNEGGAYGREESEGRIFLVLWKGKKPSRIEIRCDGRLAEKLIGEYETVMQSRALGRDGIEVICSGQLGKDEVFDLIRHSFGISGEE